MVLAHACSVQESGTASNQVPPTSCRAGKVVHLLNENNSAVPVKIKIRTVTADDGGSTQHVVSVSCGARFAPGTMCGPPATGAANNKSLSPHLLDSTAGYALHPQVEKAPTEEIYDEKRLEVITDFNGRVLSVVRPEATVFDFAAGDLVGTSLCDTVDIFTEVSACCRL
jgi:hypothetical protein